MVQRMPAKSAYYTTSQVAEKFGVDNSTVRAWVSKEKLKPSVTTPGGHYRFARADVEALLSPQSTPSSAVSPQDVPQAGEGVSSLAGDAA